MKGQLEIFGIAVVMVLMLLALVVYLQLSSNPNSKVVSFTSKRLPTQLISVILKTTTLCNDQNIETLIIDVSKASVGEVIDENNLISCSVDGVAESSFSVVNYVLPLLLNESLGLSKYNYEFLVSQNDVSIFSVNSSKDCSNARKVDADVFSIKSRAIIDVSLRIC